MMTQQLFLSICYFVKNAILLINILFPFLFLIVALSFFSMAPNLKFFWNIFVKNNKIHRRIIFLFRKIFISRKIRHGRGRRNRRNLRGRSLHDRSRRSRVRTHDRRSRRAQLRPCRCRRTRLRWPSRPQTRPTKVSFWIRSMQNISSMLHNLYQELIGHYNIKRG